MTFQVNPLRATALACASGAAGWWLATLGASQAAAVTLDGVVVAAVSLTGAAACLGLAVLALAALVESALGWRPRALGALPAPLRRFLVGSVAAAVLAGMAAPATAEESYPGWAPAVPVASASPSPTATAPAPSPSPSPVVTEEPVVELHDESFAGPIDEKPEQPTAPAPRGDEAPSAPTSAGSHTVERGDSLWRITAELLGPDASNAAIADAWPLIYQANRSTIGDDPGLILPGQQLTIPKEVAA